jgi:arylsulfatase A-like enzyme
MPGRKNAEQVVDEFLAWREDQGDRPYFAFLNLFDAHDPYAPPPPYDLRFRDTEPPNRSVEIGIPHSAEEIQGLQDSYDGALAYLDAEIGRLVEALRADGSLDQTLIIVNSDHGEEFAEQGHLWHGSGLHFPALHVPLIVRWPAGGVPAGATVQDAVSIVDVPATILELIGDRGPQALPGTSLAPLWRGESSARISPILSELYWAPNQPEAYPVAGGDLHSLVRGRWHLIAGPGASEELYDIMADPFERHDLAAVPELADTLRSMREALAAFPMLDRGGR